MSRESANRSFERFMMGINPGFRLDALRSDQRGSYDEYEQTEFRRQRGPVRVNSEGNNIIATVKFKLEERTIVTDYPDGRRIEVGPNGRVETPPPQSK